MSETVIATLRGQLPSLDRQKHWRPVDLKMRLERNFPSLFKAGQCLRDAERVRLSNLIENCQACLAHRLSDEQLAGLLTSLFNTLQFPNKGHGNKAMLDTYSFCLDGVSYPVLLRAIGDIIRGRANGLSRVFLPTCTELMHYCDAITTQVHGCIAQAKRLLDASETQRVGASRRKNARAETPNAFGHTRKTRGDNKGRGRAGMTPANGAEFGVNPIRYNKSITSRPLFHIRQGMETANSNVKCFKNDYR